MKKMKKVVSLEASPYAVYEDARTRLKHQSLMQDYEELDKVNFFNGFSLDLNFLLFILCFSR